MHCIITSFVYTTYNIFIYLFFLSLTKISSIYSHSQYFKPNKKQNIKRKKKHKKKNQTNKQQKQYTMKKRKKYK